VAAGAAQPAAAPTAAVEVAPATPTQPTAPAEQSAVAAAGTAVPTGGPSAAAGAVQVGSAPVPSVASTPTTVAAGAAAPSAPTPAVIGAVTPGAAIVSEGGGGGSRRSPFFGLYPFSTNFDTPPQERSLLAEAGAGLAQIAVDWGQIEFDEGYADRYGPQGSFDSTYIAPVDKRIGEVAASGFTPVLLIVNPPAWALVTPQTQGPLKPEKLPKYVSFVKRLAQRYSPAPYNARYVVLFPEPDHRGSIPASCGGKMLPHHRGWGDAPGQFAAMLRQTYPAVKAAAPGVSVIMGALAYDNFGGPGQPGFNSGPCGPFNYTFLDDVLAQGGASYIDAFAFNSYAVFGIGWEQQPQAGGAYDVAAKANVLRARFPQLSSKEWLVLESGVWSDSSTWITVRTAEGGTRDVTPNDDWQAGYPAKLFARGLSVGLRSIVWYGVRDQPDDQARGLLDQAGRPKKAYHGFRQATQMLAGSTAQGPLTPRATASGKAEGYVFRTSGGGRLVVVWAVGDQSARARVTVDMPGGGVRSADVTGAPVAGLQVQGDQVTLEVGSGPVYLTSGS
jgi:hypothetical protein